MNKKNDTQVSWEDVEKIYEEALKDFTELEELGARCILGIPVSLPKKIFIDRYEYTVENRVGSPEAVLQNMIYHAKDVLVECAKITAKDWVLKSIIKRSGRNCFASWNWSPLEGECTIYKYNPLTKKKIDQKDIPCPRDEEAHVLANFTAVNEMGRLSWINECLLEARNIISKCSYVKGVGVIVEKVWDLEEEAEKWYGSLKEKWEKLYEKYSFKK